MTSAVRRRCAFWSSKIRLHQKFSGQCVLRSTGTHADFPLGALFHIQVESVGDGSPYLQSRRNEDPVAASPATSENGSISLITHQVRDVSPGVIGVELTLGLAGKRFAGGASGKADSPGRNRVPALATLSALGSYIRFASKGSGPTLSLESVSEFSLGASRVAVVVVTMSGHSAPLIASWPLTGPSGPAVVRATLEATARRVTRLSMGGDQATGPTEPVEPVKPVKPVEPVEPVKSVEPAEPMEPVEPLEPAGAVGSGGILRQQAESLLESAGPIASAHMVLDNMRRVSNSHSGYGGTIETGSLPNGDNSPRGGSRPQGQVGPDHRGPEPPFPRGVGARSPPNVAEYTRRCLVGLCVPPRSRGPPHRGQDGREAGGRRTYRGKRRLV